MKRTKKFLALLLALLLGLGLSAPAMAQEGEEDFAEVIVLVLAQEGDGEDGEIDQNAIPVITAQPVAPAGKIPRKGSFTLRIEAYIPNGDPIGYYWVRDAIQRAGPAADREYWDGDDTITLPAHTKRSEYYCYVYNQSYGLTGAGFDYRVRSDSVVPQIEYTLLRKIADVLFTPLYLVTRLFGVEDERVLGTLFRAVFALPVMFAAMLIMGIITAPLGLLLLAPVSYIAFWFGLEDYL